MSKPPEVALVPKVTEEFLGTLALAVIACGRDREVDQPEAIAFALWCYGTAGRKPPDFGRLSED